MQRLPRVIGQFAFEGSYESAEICSNGNINDTFILSYKQENGTVRRYVLQYINSKVFQDPEKVMANIEAVTEHLRRKISKQGGNPSREAMRIISTTDGSTFYRGLAGDYWRAYDFVEGARTYQQVENPRHFYHAGRAFGQFQLLLSDFPVHTLHETIKQFHDTRKRFVDFTQAVQEDLHGRVSTVSPEIAFIQERESETSILVDLLATGKIPLRVTHNDTKLNNILIDDQSGEGVCVLDLDTVMPGSVLFDYGDAIRYGASTAPEDEPNTDLVNLDVELFRVFTEGYLDAARNFLVPLESKHLAFSVKLMALELGMRFLTDYLNGDWYFKITRPGHNLDRARAQLKLASDLEKNMPLMEEIIADILNQDPKKEVV